MKTTAEMQNRVLKMYVANYRKLTKAEHAELQKILKEIYESLTYHPERNFIFWGKVSENVLPILVTNGFSKTKLHVEPLVLPIIRW